MAERVAVMTGPDNDSIVTVSWTGLLNGDTGAEVLVTKFADKTVQVVGAFGTGGTVAIEGSNDGSTWGQLNDLQGTAIAIQDNAPIVIAGNPKWLRPDVTAGNGSTNLDVYIVAPARGT